MTEEFKKSYCQGIRLVLLWIPIGMDPLKLDLKTDKQTKSYAIPQYLTSCALMLRSSES